jgi:Calcineurin-like phosphoesterase
MSTAPIVVTYARLQEAFQKDPAQLQDAVFRSATQAANGDTQERAQLIAAWNQAVSALQQADQGNVMSTAQDPIASRLQTMIAAKSAEHGKLGDMPGSGAGKDDADGEPAPPSVLEVKFDNEDLAGWLSMSWKLIFKPAKAPWRAPSAVPEPLADDARVAVFADWGTGLYGAPRIAKSIQALDRCDVVLHLGDTYYSGSNDEIHDRLVGTWPTRNGGTRHRSLNGNHEMYSGGQGYFQALDDFFHQSASCFAMQNDRWILACLDSSYMDYALDGPQVAWLEAIVAAAGTRKLILFSHHQPFSQLDSQGPKLQVALDRLLNSQRIHAWYWGHEHRLVLYEPHSTWGLKGRCVGNGGFPAFRDKVTATPSATYEWVTLKTAPHAPAARLLDGPNPWVTDDPQRYSPHGFLTLDFVDDQVLETYYVPDGVAVAARAVL